MKYMCLVRTKHLPVNHVRLQMHTQSRARKLGVEEAELKLPVAVSISASSTRERDWSNLATAHEGDSTAYTWALPKYRCAAGRATASLLFPSLRTLHGASASHSCVQ